MIHVIMFEEIVCSICLECVEHFVDFETNQS